MDHLPSNYSPFRQQLEGSWFRSHLNSSAWHTSFQCAVVCVDAHRSVCPLHVGQDGTELHVDTHGQHSLKCVFTLGQDGTELHVDAHRSVCSLWVKTAQNRTSTLTVNTHRSVCPLWVKTAQNCTSTLTVNTHRSVCVHCGSRRHAYGWFHTRDIWEASQTVSDHWGFQTERTTSKWSTVCLMYMDLGSTLQCASTPVGPYWFHVPSWET